MWICPHSLKQGVRGFREEIIKVYKIRGRNTLKIATLFNLPVDFHMFLLTNHLSLFLQVELTGLQVCFPPH